MDLFVWVGQTVLAIVFAVLGPPKLLQPEAFAARRHATWARDLGPQKVRLIGLLETLGALALVLPLGFRTVPWLSPIAGACLAVLMLAATVFHRRRGEAADAAVTFVLGMLALMVTIGVVV